VDRGQVSGGGGTSVTVDWVMVGALGTVIYGLAFVVSIIFVLHQLDQQANESFVSGTATTFAIWEDDDFQRAQQWILYELLETTWKDFVTAHRGDYGERALFRVGGLYNRVGYLVTYNFLGKNDRVLLDTVAGPAIAVWQKIAPLVLEARLIENSTMFQDYERMLPRCYECYVPIQPLAPTRQQEEVEPVREEEKSVTTG
jgi:hypothetical protein